MYIEEIRVKNFKSFRDMRVKLGRFNVLIGANASGKSNFVDLIRFIKNMVFYGLENAFQMAGGVEYVKNLKIGDKEPMELSFVLYLPADDATLGMTAFPLPSILEYTIRIKFSREKFEIAEDRIAWYSSKNRESGIAIYKKDNKLAWDVISKTNRSVDDEIIEKIEDVLKWCEKFVNEYPNEPIIRTAPIFNLPFILTCNRIGIYNFDPKVLKMATPTYSKAELEENGSNLACILKSILSVKQKRINIVYTLKDFVPFIDDLKVDKSIDQKLFLSLVEEFYPKRSLPAGLISDGSLNILATIVALMHEDKDVCIFEEPERNIHPALIQKLVHLFKEYSNQKQIILTTHNPLIVKYAGIENILLVKRDREGFSYIVKPEKSEIVREFLRSDFGLDELFIKGIIGAGL